MRARPRAPAAAKICAQGRARTKHDDQPQRPCRPTVGGATPPPYHPDARARAGGVQRQLHALLLRGGGRELKSFRPRCPTASCQVLASRMHSIPPWCRSPPSSYSSTHGDPRSQQPACCSTRSAARSSKPCRAGLQLLCHTRYLVVSCPNPTIPKTLPLTPLRVVRSADPVRSVRSAACHGPGRDNNRRLLRPETVRRH
jgi:hypothetical protein